MSITRNTLLSISNRLVTSPSGQGRLFGCHGRISGIFMKIISNKPSFKGYLLGYVIKSCIMFYMKLYIKVGHKVVKDIKVQSLINLSI